MNDLNKVIKAFKRIHKQAKKDNAPYWITEYSEIIIKYLLLEYIYSDIVKKSGKPIYHYFKYHLPEYSKEYFEWLYNPYNPVKFAVETFDSIEEIRKELE